MTEFSQKLNDTLNVTCVGLAVALAKDTGVLKTLLEASGPLTAQQIATHNGLKERYVREILNSLVTAELLHATTNEAGDYLYHLEEEEKKALNSSLMAYTSLPGALASCYSEIKSCFQRQGPFGIRYSEPMHDVIDEFSFYDSDDFIAALLKVAGLKSKLETGIKAIEFGCGRGRLISQLASMFPNTTFVASDVVPSLLENIRARLQHIPNIEYDITDLCALPETPEKQYDWIYCADVIHDLPQPMEALQGIHKLVEKSGGIFTFIDLATSGSPLVDRGNLNVAAFYAHSTFLCIPESYQREDSLALGCCWGKQTAINMVQAAGFDVEVIKINHYALYVCKPKLQEN